MQRDGRKHLQKRKKRNEKSADDRLQRKRILENVVICNINESFTGERIATVDNRSNALYHN